jgi:hypothetical protein
VIRQRTSGRRAHADVFPALALAVSLALTFAAGEDAAGAVPLRIHGIYQVYRRSRPCCRCAALGLALADSAVAAARCRNLGAV